jgi:hypothetical protein
MKTERALELHPAGEDDFVFPTYGGTVRLRATDEALTPFGGLVPWAAFVRRCGLFEVLSASCPVVRTSPNAAAIYDVLQSYALTVLCDGDRFAHVQRLRCDPSLAELFGMDAVVSDDTIRRLFGQVEEQAGAAWVAAAAVPLWSALPEPLILDWDATVQTKYGHQEGAAKGYNPHRPGRRSLHPLLAVAAGTRLCVAYRFRSGDTVSATQWEVAMADAQRALGARRVWLNRGDLGFGHERIMAWHEASGAPRPHYLFKLRLTANVRRALAALPESAWQGPAQRGVLQIAEIALQLPGWRRARRVVAGRRLLGVIPAQEAGAFWDRARHEFEAYVTDLEASAASGWQIVELYRKRADTENVFDELKHQWGFEGFCCRKQNATALAARLGLLVYNLWHLFLRLLEPSRHVESKAGRRWFLLIAGRLTQSGRQKQFCIAVAGAWWQQLKAGYQRICRWLEQTAPQLKSPHARAPDFTFLKPAPG